MRPAGLSSEVRDRATLQPHCPLCILMHRVHLHAPHCNHDERAIFTCDIYDESTFIKKDDE